MERVKKKEKRKEKLFSDAKDKYSNPVKDSRDVQLPRNGERKSNLPREINTWSTHHFTLFQLLEERERKGEREVSKLSKNCRERKNEEERWRTNRRWPIHLKRKRTLW